MKNLYDIVAKKVIEFCRKGYFADCLVKFEMSYDGKEWDKVTCVVECDINEDIVFQWDFCEGQKYIRNFKICYTNDALIPSEAEPISRIDLQELEDRFGKYVRFVVEDMMSGEGKRWKE